MVQRTPAKTLVMSSTLIPLSGPFFSESVVRGGFRGDARACSHRRWLDWKRPYDLPEMLEDLTGQDTARAKTVDDDTALEEAILNVQVNSIDYT